MKTILVICCLSLLIQAYGDESTFFSGTKIRLTELDPQPPKSAKQVQWILSKNDHKLQTFDFNLPYQNDKDFQWPSLRLSDNKVHLELRLRYYDADRELIQVKRKTCIMEHPHLKTFKGKRIVVYNTSNDTNKDKPEGGFLSEVSHEKVLNLNQVKADLLIVKGLPSMTQQYTLKHLYRLTKQGAHVLVLLDDKTQLSLKPYTQSSIKFLQLEQLASKTQSQLMPKRLSNQVSFHLSQHSKDVVLESRKEKGGWSWFEVQNEGGKLVFCTLDLDKSANYPEPYHLIHSILEVKKS